MEYLQRQVSLIVRRITLQTFLDGWIWYWFVLWLLVAVCLGLGQFFQAWRLALMECLLFSFLLSLLLAGLKAFLHRPSSIDAALAIDQAYLLKERVSASLSLPELKRASPVGRALIADSQKCLKSVDVREKFSIRLPSRYWLPGLSFVLVMFVYHLPSRAVKPVPPSVQASDPSSEQARIQRSVQNLKKRFSNRQRQAEQGQLNEADRLFSELEKSARSLTKQTNGTRRQALVELNHLAESVRKRRDELSVAQQIKQRLRGVSLQSDGPASEFAKALAKADYAKAIQTLNELQNHLRQENGSPAERNKLRKQFEEIQQQLEMMAVLQKQMDLLRQQNKSGDGAQATADSDVEKQGGKSQEQDGELPALEQLSQNMGILQRSLRDAQLRDAVENMDVVRTDLEELARDMKELQMLESAMQDIAQARNGINCKACQGEGCSQCRSFTGNTGQGMGGNRGLGAGRGSGDRPEQETKTESYRDAVASKSNPGQARVIDMVKGNQGRGRTMMGLSESRDAANGRGADALDHQKLPRYYRDQAKGYFDAIVDSP